MAARITGALLAVLIPAACGLAEPLVIEAETAPVRTEGGPMEGGWNLWTSGRVGAYVQIAVAGEYRIVVRAYGSPLAGVWPMMPLFVDIESEEMISVKATTFTEYTFKRTLTAGIHEIAVGFVNDARSETEDRNLYLDRIEVHPPAAATVPTLATRVQAAAHVEAEEAALKTEAQQRIRKHRTAEATVTVLSADGKPLAGADVTVQMTRHKFLFGCNAYMLGRCRDAKLEKAYRDRFAALLNYATLPFYWGSYEGREGDFAEKRLKAMATWCKQNGIRTKGHPLFSHPAVEAITWWDFADLGAWQGAPAGFLRKDMSPKPSYDVLMKLIKGKWWTGPLTLRTDKQGRVTFRGFLGEYDLHAGDRKAAFRLDVAGTTAATAKLAK